MMGPHSFVFLVEISVKHKSTISGGEKGFEKFLFTAALTAYHSVCLLHQ